MELTDVDLGRVRDYTGSTPDDATLYLHAEEATTWQDVALRVLRRRYADVNAGQSATSFSLDGVLSVGLGKTDLTHLAAQIADLEAQIAGTTGGVSVHRMRRTDRYR